MNTPSTSADSAHRSRPRPQWAASAAVCLGALDAVAAVVQIQSSGPRATWWAVAGVGAVIIALAGHWLMSGAPQGSSSFWRPLTYAALVGGVAALAVGLLAGFGLIFGAPKPVAAITFPREDDTVGVCEHFRGTSAGIPDDQTLVLAVRDGTSGQPEIYLYTIQDWDTADRPDAWSATIFFRTPGHTYHARVYMVSRDEVKSESADLRDRRIWHKPAPPVHWRYLTKTSVVGRAGQGTSGCSVK